MVKLEGYKRDTENRAIEKITLPAKAYIPLSQHLGKVCEPEVKVGDRVSCGQRIAGASAHISANIHASVSGKVTAIQEYPHPLLKSCKAIAIEADMLDSHQPQASGLKQKEIDELAPGEIRAIVFEAGIVGMGGAGFPTHIKLNPPKPIDTLIINGAECEPYLTGDYRLMVERTREILLGISLVARCVAARKVLIAIEEDKPAATKAFSLQIPVVNFQLISLGSRYPQGGEKQLIKKALGKEVPQGKLPFDIGVLVHNVATVYAVYKAVYLGEPLIERVVTVSGSCLNDPKNILARIGTPIKELIDFCGPLKEEPAKVVTGGPMMGIAQHTDSVPVIKTTTGIVLMNEKEAQLRKEEVCIRCGACVRECPAGLMPCLVNLVSERMMWDEAKAYNVMDCIECGLCNYVCPANRGLTQSIKRAKSEVSR